jgi:tRNA(His) 5'-end guanylyltransferase
MTENKSLADRMKEYENRDKIQYPSSSVVVARIDGRGFSKFTKKFDKPFDKKFTHAMIQTTKALVQETCATIGYTQSDEISLIWHTDNPDGQLFFNGKVQKLCSVCASIATAHFNDWMHRLKVKTNDNGLFDCRVFEVPDKNEAVNYLFYRQRDAIRNSISMAAHTHFGHKTLMNKSTNEQLEMLKSDDINWFDYPPANQIGSFVKRERFEKVVKETGEVCDRSRVVTIDLTDVIVFEEMKKIVFGDENV